MQEIGLVPQLQVAPQPPRYYPQQHATGAHYAAATSSSWVQLQRRPYSDDHMSEGDDYDHDSYTLAAAAGPVFVPAGAHTSKHPMSAIHGGSEDQQGGEEDEASEELSGGTASGSPLLRSNAPAPFGTPFVMGPVPVPVFMPSPEASAPHRTSTPPPAKRSKLTSAGGAGPSILGVVPPAAAALRLSFAKGPRQGGMGALEGASPVLSGSPADTPLAAHLALRPPGSLFGPGPMPFVPLLGTSGISPFAAAQPMRAPLHDVVPMVSPTMAAVYAERLGRQRMAAAMQQAQLAEFEAQMRALVQQAEMEHALKAAQMQQAAARAPSGGASGLSSDEVEAVEAMLLLSERAVFFH